MIKIWTIIAIVGVIDGAGRLRGINYLHLELLLILTLVSLFLLYHVEDRLNCETLFGAELLKLVDASVVNGYVDVEVAEDGQLPAFLNEDFGALALGVALLHQVEDWSNVPISRCHKIP